MKHYSTKELLAASEKVPSSIQEALSSETTISTISNLGTKFQLHIDQIGLVAELNVQVLLGLIGPEEFLKELIVAGIPDKDAREIMTEINQKIFIPLRKKEEEKGGTTAPEVRPSPEILKGEPQKTVPEPTSHFSLQNKIPLPPPISQPQKSEKPIPFATVSQGSLPPKVFLPRPATLGEVVRSVLTAPKPLDSNNLLEDHEEPHLEINKILVPQNLPGAMPEQVIPEVPTPEVRPSPELPKVEPQIQPVAPIAPVTPKPIAVDPITSYSSDPYREPIDEPVDEM